MAPALLLAEVLPSDRRSASSLLRDEDDESDSIPDLEDVSDSDSECDCACHHHFPDVKPSAIQYVHNSTVFDILHNLPGIQRTKPLLGIDWDARWRTDKPRALAFKPSLLDVDWDAPWRLSKQRMSASERSAVFADRHEFWSSPTHAMLLKEERYSIMDTVSSAVRAAYGQTGSKLWLLSQPSAGSVDAECCEREWVTGQNLSGPVCISYDTACTGTNAHSEARLKARL